LDREVGNGHSSSLHRAPVHGFLSDRDYKSNNLAAYIKPTWLEGLQAGANTYHDRLYPPGGARVNQSITGFYAVYLDPQWEFMNEPVLLRNQPPQTQKPSRRS
jgi:hypothetical protein